MKRNIRILFCLLACTMLIGVLCTALAETPTIGGIVTFGRYEQDNNLGNGKEPIEWVVLEYNPTDDQVLLTSRYGLDARAFDSGDYYPTWECSDIRAWLNNEFYYEAFSSSDRNAIHANIVFTPDYNYTSGGEETYDPVFLLSREEIGSYLSTRTARKLLPTAYARARGAHQSRSQTLNGKRTCFYWLRSPGDDDERACNVNTDGSIGNEDSSVHDRTACIRPAVWVDSDIALTNRGKSGYIQQETHEAKPRAGHLMQRWNSRVSSDRQVSFKNVRGASRQNQAGTLNGVSIGKHAAWFLGGGSWSMENLLRGMWDMIDTYGYTDVDGTLEVSVQSLDLGSTATLEESELYCWRDRGNDTTYEFYLYTLDSTDTLYEFMIMMYGQDDNGEAYDVALISITDKNNGSYMEIKPQGRSYGTDYEHGIALGSRQVANCTSWISLRAAPDTNSTRLARIPVGTWLDVWAFDAYFAYTEYKGQYGYVLWRYLE